MRRKPFKKRQPERIFIKANHQVRYPEVRVLDESGELVGVMPSRDAFFKAQEQGKDLVLITEKSQPPVVKIIDLAKHKYQLKQKQAKARKKSRKQDLKEIRFSPFIGEGDYESRLKKITDFLKRGDKVRLQLQFKGREITKKEFGYEIFTNVIKATEELAIVEIEPKMIGKNLMAQLSPKTSKKT